MNANKNMGVIERLEEGAVTWGPPILGIMIGVAVEGPKWLVDEVHEIADEVQERWQARNQVSHEQPDTASVENVIQMPPAQAQYLGSSAVEDRQVA